LRNPLAFLFEKKSSYTLSDPRLFEIFGTGPTLSGVDVGPETALRVPAVNAAVRVIAESIASLPVNILKDDGESKIVDKKHALFRMLHYEPNAWSSSYDFRLQMMVDVLLHGNAYAFVNRVSGTVREIIRLQPTSVAVQIDLYSGEPSYEIRAASGGIRKCSYADIIHVRALSTNGAVGVAPIQHAREAIALALALEGHAAKLMGNAGRPSGILKVKGKLTPTMIDRIKTQWSQSQSGGSAGGTAIFDTETDFSPLTFNSVDMQFVELRKFQLDEVSRAFRVPPHLLSELGRVTWANASELGQNFLDYTILPWLMNFQGALAMTLLTPEERVNTFIEFDTSALTRANLTARTDAYSKAVGGPWMLANEARSLENRAPIAGGDVLNEPPGSGPPQTKENPNHDERGRFAAAAGSSTVQDLAATAAGIIAQAAAHTFIGGTAGAAVGAGLRAFIDTGGARIVAKAALKLAGFASLPDWAHTILKATIHVKSNIPAATPKNIESFLSKLSSDEIKRLAHDIVATMSDGHQKTLLAQLVANDNNEPSKDALAA